jgi:hypothetical protein
MQMLGKPDAVLISFERPKPRIRERWPATRWTSG